MSIRFDLSDAKIGDTFIQPFRFQNSAGEAVEQAGQVYRFSLSLNPTLDDAAAEIFQEITVEPSEAATEGIVSFQIDTSLSATLKPASYYYELKRVSPGDPESIVLTLLHGKVKFTY